MLIKANKPASAAGFTLVELMISLVIVLILMLGINFVFSTSAKTISTGMALSSVGRDIRGARKTFAADFGNAVTADEMPAIIIHGEQIYAFRDKKDRLGDLDYNPGDTWPSDSMRPEPTTQTAGYSQVIRITVTKLRC